METTSSDLVLVGAGHAHVQVLRRWMMAPVPGVRLTLVVDLPEAAYSGMVPGLVAGDYAPHELAIDAVPLARRAGARVVIAAAESVDVAAHRLAVAGRAPLAYDVASFDVGSTVRGLELPGVREHALATRPIARFVSELDRRVQALSRSPRVLVVGAGVAGVELALTLDARLRAAGSEPAIRIATSDSSVLSGHSSWVRGRMARLLETRGIRVLTGASASEVRAEGAVVGGAELEADLVIWATGAAPLPFPRGRGLPLDSDGFLRVGPELEVEDCPDLFAAGDCASFPFAPWVRKAGVWAVRAGPVLDANLRARLRGGRTRRFRPQRDFLTLLNLGGREAFGTKWGVPVVGSAVFDLKDWIDRRFVRRFQVLDADGAPAPDFPSPEEMGMEEMPCGGCAAKLGANALESALRNLPGAPPDASVRLGLEAPDDAALVEIAEGALLLTSVDAFRAFGDDPWWVGRVAAVNALADVYAKGGQPRFALAWVNVPEDQPRRAENTLLQVLSGVRAALDPLGVSLVGGHTTQGGELSVGLSVAGAPGGPVPVASGLQPGQKLLLTKSLGSGVLLAAHMRGLLPGAELLALLDAMARPCAEAARVARDFGATACTDVSGFGLAGHLSELVRASGVSVRVYAERLPVHPAARALLGRGVRSSYHAQNAAAGYGLAPARDVAAEDVALLYDPQTSGGLLFGVNPQRAPQALDALRTAGDRSAALIGEVTAVHGAGGLIELCSAP